MNLLNFSTIFPDEASCKAKWKAMRDKRQGKPRKVNHIKMIVIDDLQAKTIDNQVLKNINKDAVIDSDNSTS